MESFLSDSEIAELHQMMDNGNLTIQKFQRPQAVVDFQRMDETTGQMSTIEEDVQLIAIRFGLREGSGGGQVITQDFADGDMDLWADGFIPEVGDMFMWGGHPAKVTKVYPEDQGTVTCEIAIQQVTT